MYREECSSSGSGLSGLLSTKPNVVTILWRRMADTHNFVVRMFKSSAPFVSYSFSSPSETSVGFDKALPMSPSLGMAQVQKSPDDTDDCVPYNSNMALDVVLVVYLPRTMFSCPCKTCLPDVSRIGAGNHCENISKPAVTPTC
jgi:hypothetical protein